MRYFGPYKDETVDFSKLTEAAVFLVSGNTGSGKTTIFDAMCYALFGQTTNDQDRDAVALRSDFAPHNQETSVTFVFKHQGSTYQITRKPKQTLTGRGNKLVEHSTKVSLVYPLEEEQPSEINKVNVANSFIENLLNLTRDQFKQIVLLPQGKFRQFLESSSNEKEKLLRDLFNTTLYEQWAQKLKDRLAEQKKQQQDIATKLQTTKENFTQVDASLPNDEWLKQAKQEITVHQEKITDISREIQKSQQKVTSINQQIDHQQRIIDAFNERKIKQKELDELNKQSTQMTDLHDRIDQLMWYQGHQKDYLTYLHVQDDLHEEQTKLQASHKQLTQTQSRQAKLQEESKQLAKQLTRIEQVREQITVLKNQLPQYAKKAQLTSQATKQADIVKKHQAKFDEYQTTIKNTKQRLQEIDGLLDDLENLAEDRVILEKDHHLFENVETSLTEYQEHQQRLDQLDQQIKVTQDQLAVISDQVEEKRHNYEDLRDAHARSEIARLVQELKPGSPCPVCGSREHPHPASIKGDYREISSEQVDQANESLMKVQQQRATQQSRLKELQTQQNHETLIIEKLLDKVNQLMATDYSTFSDVQKNVDQMERNLTKRQEQLNDSKHHQQMLQTEQATLHENVENLQQEATKTQTVLNQAREKLTTTQAALQVISSNLPNEYHDQQTAQIQLDKWQSEVAEFERHQEHNQQQLSSINEKVATVHQLIDDGQIAIKHDQTQVKALKKQLLLALQKYDVQLKWDFWQQANQDAKYLTDMQQEWQEYQTKQAQLHSLLQRLDEQIAEQPLPDIAKTKEQLAEVQHQAADHQQRKGELQNSLQRMQETYQEVIKIDHQQSDKLKKLQDLQTVSDVMNGNTDNKLSLERYVLQSYLNEVLRVANERLIKLTNGRYAFVLSGDQAKGNGTKWSGLEINVYDDNAGQERSVRTLSGGESFIASLALALGLGEVIQERSGGIQVDALFIDEGFGSLDQEALNQALNALQTIKGYQMIGIISHVTELENQVPNQLQVVSQNGVSHVRYRYDINNL